MGPNNDPGYVKYLGLKPSDEYVLFVYYHNFGQHECFAMEGVDGFFAQPPFTFGLIVDYCEIERSANMIGCGIDHLL